MLMHARRLLTIVSLLLFPTIAVLAATFNVSTVHEFRAALLTAESNAQNDTILLAPGSYNVGDLGGPLLTYTAITSPVENCTLTIECTNGVAGLDGNSSKRILIIDAFQTSTNGRDSHVAIRGLAFSNGLTSMEGIFGAALFARTEKANILVEDCLFQNNRAYHFFDDPSSGGMFAKAGGSGELTVRRCRFLNNSASGTGGALYITGGGMVTVINNVFASNRCAAVGGALYLNASWNTLIANNTFTGNTNDGWAAWCAGAGMCVRQYSDSSVLKIRNNIFWGNGTDAGPGDDIYLQNDANSNGTAAVVFVVCNDYADLAYELSSNMVLQGNIDADPLFADESNLDYRLTSGSPCIDAGTNLAEVTDDMDRVPRPLDGSNDGTNLYDIGAHEYVHPTADSDGDRLSDTNELFHADTDPLDSNSVLALLDITRQSGDVIIEWKGGVSATQYVEWCSSLIETASAWSVSWTNVPPTPVRTNYLDAVTSGETRFYRIRAVKN